MLRSPTNYRTPSPRDLPAAQWLIADEHRVWCDLWSPNGVTCTCGHGPAADPADVVNLFASVAHRDFIEGYRA